MPCVWVPQSYPSPGPPQAWTTAPAGSKAITGGVFSAPRWLFGRWMIQTLSLESVATPTTLPSSQSPGSSCGQNGSTWNVGAEDGWAALSADAASAISASGWQVAKSTRAHAVSRGRKRMMVMGMSAGSLVTMSRAAVPAVTQMGATAHEERGPPG